MSSSTRHRPTTSAALEKAPTSDDIPITSSKSSSTTPAVPASTIYKLLLFTFAMFSFPLFAYFGTVNTVFGGNATYAGALAALTANLVLGGYIVTAVMEDQGEPVKVGKVE